ncbi:MULTISPECIES: thioredoxin [unclassified Schlesneria]|uniref:thioredoxin n=1 Tax=Schlesneria TaxID=656899 RepID=UPI002F226B62
MAGNVAEFSDAGFQSDVINSKEPVLVDFWAPWCGPCKMLGPTIEELAKDYSGRAKIGKVNIDDNQDVASEYGVSSIPTVIVFKNGQIVDRFVGVTPKSRLSAAIDKHL